MTLKNSLLFAVALLTTLSVLLTVKPQAASAASADECYALNGKKSTEVDSTLLNNCISANYCSQTSEITVGTDHYRDISCKSTAELKNEGMTYARSQYGSAIVIQATAICSNKNSGTASKDCLDDFTNKFYSCFDTYVKGSSFTYPTFDIDYLAKCTAGGNTDYTKQFTTALDTVNDSVSAKTASLAATADSDAPESTSCDDSPIGWIACPLINKLAESAKAMGGIIANILYISPENIFSKNFQDAWGNFRMLGMALIVIAGLFMVISQGLGLEILDAYTIRKTLPRLGIALIGIALSWPLLKLSLDATNSIGLMTHDLILSPFKKLGYPPDYMVSDILSQLVISAAAGIFAVGTFIQIAFLGVAGIGSLILTVLGAILIGLLVLYVREVVIMACIILAPLAIAAYVLPGTQKIWSFWKNTFVTSLAMFPIIMAFLAAGEALSRVEAAANGGKMSFTGVIVYFAPYFMLPFAFKLAGGLMSTIFSIANDRSRGFFDRNRKFRQDTKAYNKDRYAKGTAATEGSLRDRIAGGWARRTTLGREGAFSVTKSGRARYRAGVTNLQKKGNAESAEADALLQSGNDTDLMEILQDESITSRGKQAVLSEWASRYQKTHGGSQEQAMAKARESLGRFETGSGIRFGSRAMLGFANQASHKDNTAYMRDAVEKDENGNDLTEEVTMPNGTVKRQLLLKYKKDEAGNYIYEIDGATGQRVRVKTGERETDWAKISQHAANLVRNGTLSSVDAAAIIKSNPNRGDISSIGFGDVLKHVEALRLGSKMGEGNALSVTALQNKAAEGIRPGDLLMGHPNTGKAMAPVFRRRVEELAKKSVVEQQAVNAAMATYTAGEAAVQQAQVEYDQAIAAGRGVPTVQQQLTINQKAQNIKIRQAAAKEAQVKLNDVQTKLKGTETLFKREIAAMKGRHDQLSATSIERATPIAEALGATFTSDGVSDDLKKIFETQQLDNNGKVQTVTKASMSMNEIGEKLDSDPVLRRYRREYAQAEADGAQRIAQQGIINQYGQVNVQPGAGGVGSGTPGTP